MNKRGHPNVEVGVVSGRQWCYLVLLECDDSDRITAGAARGSGGGIVG